jgi:branched-chain amino acid transport system ATP-binding protein
MLRIENLCAYYGSIMALNNINLEIMKGQICCIIGSNGAGKSTLAKSISGMVKITGQISWDGKVISGLSPRNIAKLGVTHVPEGRHIFTGLTVRENLAVGAITWHGFFGRKSYNAELETVYTLFPRLKERENQMGWSLSGGEQQMLAIGRALMSRPSILILDEPSMGLAPAVMGELFKKIVEINKTQNLTILLIEQNAKLALTISGYVYIIENGTIGLHGTTAELKDDDRIAGAYFGKFAKKA